MGYIARPETCAPSPAGEGWGEENKNNYLYPPHPNLIMLDRPVHHPTGKCKSAPGGFVPEGEGANVTLLAADSICLLDTHV